MCDRIDFPGITLSRNMLPAGSREIFFMHTHKTAELFFFHAGKGIYHVEGNVYHLHAGDVLLMRPMEAHFIELDNTQDYDRTVVHFDPDIFSSFDPDGSLMQPYYRREAGEHNRLRARDFESNRHQQYLDDMLQCGGDRLALMANFILLLREVGAAFGKVDRTNSHPDTMEYHMLRYINQNLHRDITLQELSEQFFLSRAQLCLRFKNATGTSVGKYISVKRLMLARQWIRQGEKPTNVYSECGYQDYSTFYRAYTRLFGHSPKQESSLPDLGDLRELIDLG